ncbi:MAG: M48 family metallopeptidase [Candidatus Kerfeldbacteria bacterium]
MTLYSQIASNKRKSMALTFVFILVIIGIGWLLTQYTKMGYLWLFIISAIAVFMSIGGYYRGDVIALWTAGAKPISKDQNSYVYNIVENLCITAGLPVPKIHIINDPAINAFATGRNPEHASIAITTGAIEKLQNEELEGVVAHELAHIKNYDIRLMTMVIIMVSFIVLLSNMTFRSNLFGGRVSSRNNSSGRIHLVIILITLIITPLIAQLIKFTIARKREFLADASGALLTRYPEGLAKALEKISQQNIEPMRKANNASAHLYISNPFGNKAKKGIAKMFSTHPPIEERIAALRGMR